MMRVDRILAGCVLAGLGTAPLAANDTPGLEFAFEEVVALAPMVPVGATSKGERRFIPITGGRFEGPGLAGEGIKGEIMPGGWDWQLTRPDGCTEIEADYFLKTDDGVIINVVNKGALCPPAEGDQPTPVRTHPVFEAPIGKYDWLSKSAFIGTLELADPAEGHAVKIRFYRAN